MPPRGGGHARVVVCRVEGGPLITELQPDRRTRQDVPEGPAVTLLWETPGGLDHRMPSEVARLTAEEREVAPSFM